MARLRQADLMGLLALVQEVGGVATLEEFPARMLPLVRNLLGAELATYTENDPTRASGVWAIDPAGAPFPGALEVFDHYLHEHPLVAHFERTRDLRATKISDLVGLRRFQRLGLYQECFRAIGARYQLATSFPAEGPLLIGIGLMRTHADFSERERTLLDLLRPHLAQAYAAAAVRSRLRRRATALEAALAAGAQAALVLGPSGGIGYATDEARRLLAAYFAPAAGGRLPERIADWLRDARGRAGDPAPRTTELAVDGADAHLRVRLLPRSEDGGGDVLLLEEARDPLAADTLAAAGLTRREAEVVRLIAGGRTNAEIAAALSIGRRTVDKHVENLLGKLGAANRAEAVATLAVARPR